MTTNSACGIGSSSITTLGTVGTGVWQATPVTVPFGGTGDSSFTAYSILCGGTTSTGVLQNVSGLGSSGQVLTSNGASALPTWQSAGGGSGKFTLITSITASNQATVSFNSEFTSTYNVYFFTFTNIQPVNSTDQFYSQVGTGATPTWTTSGYNWQNFLIVNGAELGLDGTPDTKFALSSTSSASYMTNSSAGYNGYLYVVGANGTSNYLQAYGQGTYISTGTPYTSLCQQSAYNSAANYTSIKFYFNGGNVNSGTIRMYGLTP